MANTLTGLIPVIYQSIDEISRELIGCIPAASINVDAASAAVGQIITVPITPVSASADTVPNRQAPDTGDQNIGSINMLITKNKHVPVRWNGNEQVSIGTKYDKILKDQFTQAFRTLTNEIELDLCSEAYKNASRAFGVAGTAPFASSLAGIAQIKKILDDNGAPIMDRALIIDTSAGVNMRTLANLNTVNAAGTDKTLRQGTLLPLFNIDVKESAQIQNHTKGTATGADIVVAGEAVGETELSLEGSDAGTVLAGDVVTFAGGATDANKYVVLSGGTLSGNATGDITIGNPGLKIVKVNADEMTIGANYTANFAFQKQALQLLARSPELPKEGDSAVDRTYVVEPITGLTFEIAMYKEFRQVWFMVGIAWGVKAIKSEHIALLLG